MSGQEHGNANLRWLFDTGAQCWNDSHRHSGRSPGWLPNGPNGFRKGRGVFRHENPIGFWFFFGLYVAVGIQGTLYALRVLSGQVPM